MDKKIESPIVKGGAAILLEEIETKRIIHSYQYILGINVDRFFYNKKTIGYYKCEHTGYKFFAPFNGIMGDSGFYEELGKIDWYYMPWKWEHEVFLNEVSKEKKILEIGSGGLGFIKRLVDSGFIVTGLELNQTSVNEAKKMGLDIRPEFIEQFSEKNDELFDIVCSFQVLEHVTNIKSFIDASLKVLKKGGKFIICVPNNESFIRFDKSFLMNFPPHHAGHWDTNSVQKLANYFPLKVEKILYEPLQPYHYDWYINVLSENYFIKYLPFGTTILKKYFSNRLKKRLDKIKGHSLFAVFIKN